MPYFVHTVSIHSLLVLSFDSFIYNNKQGKGVQNPHSFISLKLPSSFSSIPRFPIGFRFRFPSLTTMASHGGILGLIPGDLLHVSQSSQLVPGFKDSLTTRSDPDFNMGNSGGSDAGYPQRIIVVAHFLPIKAEKDEHDNTWSFSFDEDSLYLHLKDGFSPETDVFYVGSLGVNINPADQEAVALKLLEDFNCVPTFLPPELHTRFYHGFCKQYLWPLFHYMLPMSLDHGMRFDEELWKAYVTANLTFADKIMHVLSPEEDYVWVHDYHLMLVPTFLRRRFHTVKIGFFLHSPFPSAEIYRTLPVRDAILKALLNFDLIGFHTFDYARHFLSCCSRMLGLDYESKKGFLGVDYFGRTIHVKILPVGIHLGHLEAALNHPLASAKAKQIRKQFDGKMVILGVDDMDIFKGISLKLLAVEHLLQQDSGLRGKFVMVQIINPARSTGKYVQESKTETFEIAQRINDVYGQAGHYQPVILVDYPLSFFEKASYYARADCCIVNAVRDGLNLIPYEYVICRQGSPKMDEAFGISSDSARSSTLVVSEFVGCSPSLSGAIRVNPWSFTDVAEAISTAISMSDIDKKHRHERHYRYVSSHDVSYWSRSFMQDLERFSSDNVRMQCWGLGFGLTFRVMALSPSFRRLSSESIGSSYKAAKRRAIFLDYDGTIVSESSTAQPPSPELVSVLNKICSEPENMIFIVSGRRRDQLAAWFDQCDNLGIAAEHGFFLRWEKAKEWEIRSIRADDDWKKNAESVMKLYADTTDGSYIEVKESALVWQYGNASPEFGACQAKELLDHLEDVLANEPVIVTRGNHIVEVKPQGISKGLAVEHVLKRMIGAGDVPDFLLCIGDDQSDEDMFESISKLASSCRSSSLGSGPEVFACTIGPKPSKAQYYLEDASYVVNLLQGLACGSNERDPVNVAGQDELFGQVSFEKGKLDDD